MMNSTRLLALEGVDIAYPARDGPGDLQVVCGFDLTVDRGELVCVAGRSGSGKSSILNVASGLIRPRRGTVRWSGRPLADLSEAERARMRREFLGLVFQSGALMPLLTAEENVALPGLPPAMRNDGRHRARSLLELVGLGTRHHHFPAHLSAGEQQRVAIARALYGDPALLLVDEPTANLDRVNANVVIELLVAQALAGRGVLVASHDPSLINRANRVIVLET